MGMNLDAIIYLQRSEFLSSAKNRVLDIGPQTIYNARTDQIREIVERQDCPPPDISVVERLVYFSHPRPEERTTMLSEITDLTNIRYEAIDVCPGLKNTHILDLNFDKLPRSARKTFDVVLNFGTTEHIFNQWRCFELIHDALKVGGVAYHQLPASGYMDHGYFCYTPLFFNDLARANGYEIKYLVVTHAGESRIDDLKICSLAGETILKPPGPLGENNRVPALNIHVIMRKTIDAPFRVGLEIATAHSAPDSRVLERYTTAGRTRIAPLLFERLSRIIMG
ncbi:MULTISPECIES: hypothetical protein [unclassified Bradyrhizobium]|uniref:hypothetical protein n=1 Tax=unclassified Bradyrhizobium TaxID=2631580 RepID=UPI0028EBBD8A|nr:MULTISPECIES: hypothetical protein [unclassified Bradyrhizobium]